jgi:hypothetical protein
MSECDQKILGHSWEDIQKMQQKEYTPPTVSLAGSGKKPPTEADYKMLEKYGEQGLRDMQYYGVLDRLNLPFSI